MNGVDGREGVVVVRGTGIEAGGKGMDIRAGGDQMDGL